MNSDNLGFLGYKALQSEYKPSDREIIIFSKFWYKTGSAQKKRRLLIEHFEFERAHFEMPTLSGNRLKYYYKVFLCIFT